ncbi:hypothetical protein RAT170B_0576 [Rickettsia argasii T170-B]|uniref:Uncharacterized protein n=1 Tax=Rickettsia argasii T170-B TaxID=1268837 RepID=A0A0F3RFI0_9RICK|nr:hypothetical protein RAT170B_0576 [Rickettsia argasii T170-B]
MKFMKILYQFRSDICRKKEEQNELELELDYKSSKILEIDCEIKLLNLVFLKKFMHFLKPQNTILAMSKNGI